MNSRTERKICRLCLQKCDQYEIIKGVTRQILNSLSLKLNLDISDEPVMCDNCTCKLKKSFCFKSMVDTHVFAPIIKPEDATLDLREILIYEEDTDECRTLCGMCMNPVKTGFFIPLDNLEEEGIFQRVMLEECLPDLDLNGTKNPVVCTSCNKSLKSHYDFVTELSSIERNIKLYCETEEPNSGKINLSNVRKFMYRGMFCAEDNYFVEDEYCKDQESPNEEMEMENKSFIEIIEHEVISGTDEKFETNTNHDDSSEIEVVLPQLEADVKLSTSRTISILKSQEIYSERPKRNRNPQETPSGSPERKPDKYSDKVEGKANARKRKMAHKDISGTIMYKCQSCAFKTELEDSLTQHMLTHTEKIIMYMCESCPFKTRFKTALETHNLVHMDPKETTMYPCKYCSYRSKYKGNIKKHMEKCKRSSKTKSNKITERHPATKVAHSRQSRLCETKRRRELKDVPIQKWSKDKQIESSGTKLYQCTSCSFKARYRGNLQKHMLAHKLRDAKIEKKSGDTQKAALKMFQCQSCPFQSKYKKNLNSHNQMHNCSEQPMLQCKFCTYQTIYKGNLKAHVMRRHTQKAALQMFQCQSCSFQSKYKRGLDVHNRIHNYSEQPMLRCKFCTYQTIYKGNLKVHVIRCHKNSFQCKSCSYQTDQKANLKTHNIKMHSYLEGKTIQCRLCSHQAKDKGNFKEHVRKQHYKSLGALLYQCISCLFKVKYQAAIERHVLLHKDKKH